VIVIYLHVKRIGDAALPKDQAFDAVDAITSEWESRRPDLDFAYLATMGRILRISAHLRERMDSWLEPFGLSWEMFDLLVTLLRSGEPDGLRPTDLYKLCMLSSGATTNRIDRAEKLGYVERHPDREDGRATRIALTKRGRGIARQAISLHTRQATAISAALSRQERKQLGQLLGKLLRSFEGAALRSK
jgi:DNA-binding MarR family transcriptional regulator